jgi:hypothetical protein
VPVPSLDWAQLNQPSKRAVQRVTQSAEWVTSIGRAGQTGFGKGRKRSHALS